MFYLPALSFNSDELQGFLSTETLHFHYQKHHAGYVQKTNELLEEDQFKNLREKSLEEICRVAENPLADQARQAWNHTFYWDSLSVGKNEMPTTKVLRDLIETSFGGFDEFENQFKKEAIEIFGSGWLWLVQRTSDGKLGLVKAQGSDQPFWGNAKPILVCDVWEHAYYLDYRNERKEYVDSFWKHLNWNFAEMNVNALEIYSATKKMSDPLVKESVAWTTQEFPEKRLKSI